MKLQLDDSVMQSIIHQLPVEPEDSMPHYSAAELMNAANQRLYMNIQHSCWKIGQHNNVSQ